MNDELINIVEAMMPIIEKKINTSATGLKLWFEDFSLVSLTEREAVFTTPSPLKCNILSSKHLSVIKEALEEVIGFPVEIEIKVSKAKLKSSEPEEKTVVTPEIIDERVKTIDDAEDEQDDTETVMKEIINGPTPGKKSLLDEYTFENFVEGESNKFARAMCYAVAREPTTYNPLFIYGQSGLGKTHLMYAVINYIKKHHSHLNIIYKKCETFLNELIMALNAGDTASFKERYRTCDVLLIDDIQFLAGKEQTQEEFFHTFSSLYESEKQIILASDRPPKDIKPLEDRLRTRFEGSYIADVQPPSYELRIAIINKKAEYMGITISPELTDYIAQRLRSNIRQIEGVIKRLYAVYSLTSVQINKEIIDEAISVVDPGNIPADAMVERILTAVSRQYGISVQDLKSKRKTEDIANARHIAIYIIKTVTHLTLKEIGAVFNRDYSTVISSLNKVDRNIHTVNNYEEEINALIEKIKL